MRKIAWLLLVPVLWTGCAYVSKDEFLEDWDRDLDGWPIDEDCNDANPAVYPGAPDISGDGCDSDCGVRPDSDGDDWPDDSDCDPDDPSIFPWAEDIDGDGSDSDCDAKDAPRADTRPEPEIAPIDCGEILEEGE